MKKSDAYRRSSYARPSGALRHDCYTRMCTYTHPRHMQTFGAPWGLLLEALLCVIRSPRDHRTIHESSLPPFGRRTLILTRLCERYKNAHRVTARTARTVRTARKCRRNYRVVPRASVENAPSIIQLGMTDPTPCDHGARALSGGRTSSNIFFVDIEYTGLDFTRDVMLEIALVVTDSDLNQLDTYEAVIHYDEDTLARMSDWCKKEFAGSLIERVRESRKSLDDVKAELGAFIDRYRDGKKIILAGSSVGMDRLFLQYCMPDMVADRVHYRIIDVSSIMELAKRWNPSVYRSALHKPTAHRALSDATASLELLRHYRTSGFVSARPPALVHPAPMPPTATKSPPRSQWTAGQLYTAEHHCTITN